eukprot:scaffold420123_cov23-Prasinocladus_malaysianus.AAC.1
MLLLRAIRQHSLLLARSRSPKAKQLFFAIAKHKASLLVPLPRCRRFVAYEPYFSLSVVMCGAKNRQGKGQILLYYR